MSTDTLAEDEERTAWLDWRRGGLGASDISAVLGLSPWDSPWSLWAEKVGLTPPKDSNESMDFGRYAEHMIRPWFQDRTGLVVRGGQQWCTHPDISWALATPDGDVHDPGTDLLLGGLEIKTDWQSFSGWDEVPAYYQCQGQWQMFVRGQERVWFPTMHGRRLEVYELERDDADIALLVERATEFWETHVLGGVPPLVDGSDATLRALQQVYPDHTPGTTVELDQVGRAAVRLLDQARAAKREADADEKAAKARLASLMGDAEEGLEDGKRIVSYRSQDSTRLDGKTLRAELPDVAAKYERTTSTRVMRTHLPKEKKS